MGARRRPTRGHPNTPALAVAPTSGRLQCWARPNPSPARTARCTTHIAQAAIRLLKGRRRENVTPAPPVPHAASRSPVAALTVALLPAAGGGCSWRTTTSGGYIVINAASGCVIGG